MRLQLIKTSVNSSGYLYSQDQMLKFSLSKCSQKYGIALVAVSSLLYTRLKSSITKVLKKKEISKAINMYYEKYYPFGKAENGSFWTGSAAKASSVASISSAASPPAGPFSCASGFSFFPAAFSFFSSFFGGAASPFSACSFFPFLSFLPEIKSQYNPVSVKTAAK